MLAWMARRFGPGFVIPAVAATEAAAAEITALVSGGHPGPSAGVGTEVAVVLNQTPFYAESGGQVADKGVIVGPGYELEVIDVQKPVPGLVSHTVEVTTGEVAVGQPATTVVDAANRRAAAQAHSARR